MKKKDLKDLRERKEGEVKKMLVTKKNELVVASAKAGTGKEKNTSKLRVLKRDIAQMMTILKEGEITKKEAGI